MRMVPLLCWRESKNAFFYPGMQCRHVDVHIAHHGKCRRFSWSSRFIRRRQVKFKLSFANKTDSFLFLQTPRAILHGTSLFSARYPVFLALEMSSLPFFSGILCGIHVFWYLFVCTVHCLPNSALIRNISTMKVLKHVSQCATFQVSCLTLFIVNENLINFFFLVLNFVDISLFYPEIFVNMLNNDLKSGFLRGKWKKYT